MVYLPLPPPPPLLSLSLYLPTLTISHYFLCFPSNGNKITGAYSEAETKKATIKLLRTIVVLTQTLKPLPDDVMMTMKLLYYDNGEWVWLGTALYQFNVGFNIILTTSY